MKIIIIDSGIDKEHSLLKGYNIKQLKYKKSTNSSFVEENEKDEIGHGTAVGYIVGKRCPKAEILMIKAYGKDESIDEEKLIDILEYIEANIECNIINLSLTINYCKKRKRLESICNKLSDKGCIIIAAYDNSGTISYPAAFDSVIGVDMSIKCASINEYVYNETSVVNIRGMASKQRLPWINGEMKYVEGSSYIVPHIVSEVYNIMQLGISNRVKILEELKFRAKWIEQNEEPNIQKVKNIKKIIIYSISKETINLIKYSNLSSYEIIGIYDNKYHKRNGYGISNIQDVKRINWEDDFDTLIIGPVVFMSEIEIKIRVDLIEKANKNGKIVYLLDSKILKYIPDCKVMDNLFYPEKNINTFELQNYGKLWNIQCPVICVAGTSSKQGKFTVQMELRKRFLKDNYKVGQLGTEPSALLYGFDECFPYGFNSEINLNNSEQISCVNYLMHKIDDIEVDLILVGLQSNVTHASYGNIAFYPTSQYEMLMGTDPDIMVLCINYNDSLDYIDRTLSYLKAVTNVSYYVLGLFPFEKKYGWNDLTENSYIRIPEYLIEQRKIVIEKKFHCKVYNIADEGELSLLYEGIINYLK